MPLTTLTTRVSIDPSLTLLGGIHERSKSLSWRSSLYFGVYKSISMSAKQLVRKKVVAIIPFIITTHFHFFSSY